jgi:hypothetical protein
MSDRTFTILIIISYMGMFAAGGGTIFTLIHSMSRCY